MRDGVSNHQPHDCLLSCLFRRISKKTSKLRVTGLCERNSPVTGEFPAWRTSNAANVCIWWRHHEEVIRWNGWTFTDFLKQQPTNVISGHFNVCLHSFTITHKMQLEFYGSYLISRRPVHKLWTKELFCIKIYLIACSITLFIGWIYYRQIEGKLCHIRLA